MDPETKPEGGNLWRQIGQYTGLALMLPAAGLIGYFVGAELDRHWGGGNVFRVIFLFLGAAAGLIEIVRVAGRK